MSKLTINDLVQEKVKVSDLTDADIEGISYGIKYFSCAYLPREQIEVWKIIEPILRTRLTAIESKVNESPAPLCPERKETRCKRCKESSLHGASFTTIAGGNICDDCL